MQSFSAAKDIVIDALGYFTKVNKAEHHTTGEPCGVNIVTIIKLD